MEHVKVHVGGHVTLLFSIHSSSLLPRNQGSRGAGLCLEHGVEASVKISSNDDIIVVKKMDGKPLEKGELIYFELLETFREIFKISESVDIEVNLELPISQGFGMSAAGLMAVSFALGELFDVGDEGQLARIAHRIERNNSSGLGDVLGLWAGGVELRITPGSPPSPGKAIGFSADVPAILVWIPGEEKHTSGYIDNVEWKEAITDAGDRAVTNLQMAPWNRSIWPMLLSQADTFALESGLLDDSKRAGLLSTVLELIDELMSCHLCMLGNSLIIVPRDLDVLFDVDEISSVLESLELGTIITHLQ
ncbi:MAG: hypothetical protein QGI21_05410 [Candidatus Poseidoniaceae archaeon]|jgi:pantoate kinase|nr:hypothetical protein [Candidatus Poseidoniaceae archaeon]